MTSTANLLFTITNASQLPVGIIKNKSHGLVRKGRSNLPAKFQSDWILESLVNFESKVRPNGVILGVISTLTLVERP